MRTSARFALLAVLVVAIVGFSAPTAFAGLAPAASAALTPVAPGGNASLGQHVSIDIQLSSLTLGSVPSLNGVTLVFTSSSPNLTIGAFTPSSKLASWDELVALSYFNTGSSSNDITSIGSLGTLDVYSNTPGTYSIGFDGGQAKTELAGSDASAFSGYQGGGAYPLTLNSASLTVVPEPVSAVLLLGGLAVMLRRRE